MCIHYDKEDVVASANASRCLIDFACVGLFPRVYLPPHMLQLNFSDLLSTI